MHGDALAGVEGASVAAVVGQGAVHRRGRQLVPGGPAEQRWDASDRAASHSQVTSRSRSSVVLISRVLVIGSAINRQAVLWGSL